MNDQTNKRMILIIASAVDLVLSGIVVLIYFGLFPVDITSWGTPRWAIGMVGGAWFLGALVVLLDQLTKTDS